MSSELKKTTTDLRTKFKMETGYDCLVDPFQLGDYQISIGKLYFDWLEEIALKTLEDGESST